MKNRMSKAKYDEFMKRARLGNWPTALSKLGFHPPSYGMQENRELTAKEDSGFIPVDTKVIKCEPRFSRVKGKEEEFIGIWKQVEKIALVYNDRRQHGISLKSPKYVFQCDNKQFEEFCAQKPWVRQLDKNKPKPHGTLNTINLKIDGVVKSPYDKKKFMGINFIFDVGMAFVLLSIMLYKPPMIPYCICAYIISRSAQQFFGER